MLPLPTVRGARAAWTVLPVLFTATACAHVGQDDFDAGLADLRAEMRAEMQEGDEGVARSLGTRIDDVEARMERFEADLASLEEQFDVTVEQFETALRFDLPVYFDFDAADVGPEGRVVLERFSDVVLRYYPGATVTVEGFTDPAGSAEYNRRLGQRRADAVRAFLVTHGGLAEDHVRAVSYGEERVRLIAPDETGPGRPGWANRRVVTVIEHGGAPPAAVVTDPDATS
ncbi:MAG: OmpA family protein [Longimicrobiales bacterium]